MASKIYIIFLLTFISGAHSASLFESSYEYIVNFGRNVAPNIMSLFGCVSETEMWKCAKEKAGKMLDTWDAEVEKDRRSWEEEADAEVKSSGRALAELPSKLGREITESLESLSNVIQQGMARALSKKHHDSGGIDTITISTSDHMKKKKKKKPKPSKIHLIHPVIMPLRKAHKQEEKGRNFGGGVQSWVIGERALPQGQGHNSTQVTGRGVMSNILKIGDEALDELAEQAVKSENSENEITDKSSLAEQRGKKKKKKKAILKLLILGAVLKAKIGTLLQILTFKLQVKFFIVALLGLAINLARLWIDIKNKHQPPQKIIYYEHAQHQHHYDHEEEEHGWGPWSRSVYPDEPEVDSNENTPYRIQERNSQLYPVTRA